MSAGRSGATLRSGGGGTPAALQVPGVLPRSWDNHGPRDPSITPCLPQHRATRPKKMPVGGRRDAPTPSPTSIDSLFSNSGNSTSNASGHGSPTSDDDEIVQDAHNVFDEMPARSGFVGTANGYATSACVYTVVLKCSDIGPAR
ncbi:hypothetical protein EJB05_34673 [Eragrostis curvula]|uniref:Uncharacterized protein n=1 Tax=Eragrostis curvula TaxID=38414 RepID=A0A5J9U509_9POAL|nr:hypothetical protein EJB05_34673 [Eragrostis curvula]